MILGSPGKVVRELNEQRLAMLKAAADIYVANGKRFAADLEALD